SRAAASVDVAALRPGLIVAGAGGALFVLGVAAALGTEVVLGDRLHPDARQSALLAGRLALVVAGVGVVGAGVGGALLAVE
ncbi:MAG TPA: sulfite exporter TauE/SafE family protein, partial [Myxococcota bacterium]